VAKPQASGIGAGALSAKSLQHGLVRDPSRGEPGGEEFHTVLRTGVPWEEILDTAKKLDVGLIVMGTHGRRGLPRAILGSVAEKVVRLSPVPVLTVRGADLKGSEAGTPQ